MDIESIRKVFSKGSVVVDDHGISGIYTFIGDGEEWVTQSIIEDEKQVFSELLDACEKFGIGYKKGKYIKFIFYSILDGQSVVFYAPLKQEVTIAELRQMDECLPKPDNTEFYEFMSGIDLSDEDLMNERFVKWMEKINPKMKVFNIDDISRWKKIKELALTIGRALSCESEVFDFDLGEYASIELRFPENKQSISWVEGNLLDQLRELVNLSHELEIDGNVTYGYVNISFIICARTS